jgi:glycosyltransferase involved in cell wall biosynthesis
MTSSNTPVVLLYHPSAYEETSRRPQQAGPESPAGLMGRQVAGREFLDAYLAHGEWSELTAVVYDQASADSFVRFCGEHPCHRGRQLTLDVVPMGRFLERFFPTAPRTVLYTPCPPDPSFAWARLHYGPGAIALSGVTHTLCTAGAVRILNELLTAPYEPYDALICTSAAVVQMVRAVTGVYADYLRDRLGVAPALQVRLETIPLGVNPTRFRPPTPAERAAQRAALRIADDEVAVLFVGRFTPHAKAHPFPMFQGLARAAQATGRPVHLVLSGWAPNDAMLHVFLDGLRAFAPGMPVSVVNGMDPGLRFAVWQAADVFSSLSDSIQETFGLVILEAMASGLPVVASDWDGYRDLVVHGTTGFLVPTSMVRDATSDATVRLLLGAVDYDGFLAECNQAVAVDPVAAAEAYARLLRDPALRHTMGAAGRQRVAERFTWARVVRSYEELWRSQEAERQAHATHSGGAVRGCPQVGTIGAGTRPLPMRACYPAPEVSFAGYPTRWLGEDTRVETVRGAEAELGRLLAMPLCSYAAEPRVQDEQVLRSLLSAATSPRAVGELDDVLRSHGIRRGRSRATLAWLLKYGLLSVP